MGPGRPGVAPQTAKREWFARLIARGESNAEACRIVGISRRTGTRWRHGREVTSSSGRRLHYPPVIQTRKAEISPRYLSEDERLRIADLHRAEHTVRAIAADLDRSPSTVSRELRRNRDPGSGQNRPFTAQQLAADGGRAPAAEAEPRPGVAPVRGGSAEEAVESGQISQALRAEFPHEPERHLVPETIYQAVYRPELGGLHREIPKALRTGRRRRKPHHRADARRPGTWSQLRPAGDLDPSHHHRGGLQRLVSDPRAPCAFGPRDSGREEPQVSVTIETAPGEEGQADWSDCKDWGRAWGISDELQCFGAILSWSRHRFWWFAESCDRPIHSQDWSASSKMLAGSRSR
jgi:hypothetical protein